MVYATDEFYHMVRTQAVERVQDHPEDYQFFFLDQYDSPEDYISQMGTDRHWADNAIIRATADALHIEIHIISSDFSNVNTFRPDNNNPTQTVFLGHITGLHYVSTTSTRQPQLLTYGGRTSDGVTLQHTQCVDNPLTWLLNLLGEEKKLQEAVGKSKKMKILLNVLEKFRNGNSADAKKLWFEHCSEINITADEAIKSFGIYSDAAMMANKLEESVFGSFEVTHHYDSCSNRECLWKLPTKKDVLSGLNIDILNNAFLSKKERCPACPGSFIRRNVLTVASPFLVVYGDGSALKTYPKTKTFSVLINKKECNYVYRLSYVGMKRELRGERFHYMSFQEYKNKFWHYLEVLDSNPLTTFLSLPDDVAHEITFVLYICLSLLPFVNYKSENKIYNRRKGDRRPKKKATRIEVEAKLIERRNVQLVRREQLERFVEFDRTVMKVPGKGKRYLNNLGQQIKKEGLKRPIVLAVSKLTGRAYIHDGNHRMAVLKKENVEWVPVKISYFFINDDNDKRFQHIPGAVDNTWPEYPTAELMGFDVRNLAQLTFSDSDD